MITAETLLEMKAEHVVLVSRSGKVKDYEGQNLQHKLDNLLEKNNATVSIQCCDMSNVSDVSSMLSCVRKKHGEIKTIIHASGILRDNNLNKLDAGSIRSSFEPKAASAWWLHKYAYNDNMCNFVVYSSIASLFGNVGQANYSASNSYLDALIRLRRIANLPGLSIQWPAIADVGMAAAMTNDFKMSRNEMLKISQVKNVLKQLIASNIQDSLDFIRESIQAPLPQDLLYLQKFPPRLESFLSSVAKKSANVAPKNLSKTTSTDKSWTMDDVTKEVVNAIRNIIGDGNNEKIDHSLNFMDMGVDSLSIVELSKNLESRFEMKIASTLLFS